MIEALLKYQERDKDLREIEQELSSSEERKKAVSAKKYLDGVEEAIAKLDAKAAELNAAYVAATNELERIREQDTEFHNAMENATDEGAANYLLKKTDEILARIKQMTAEANKIGVEIQNLIKEYNSVKANTKAAQMQYTEFGQKYNELKASKKPAIKEIEKDLEKLKKDVDPALMEKYEKKRKEKIFPIVYKQEGNGCGYCNMELSMVELDRLKNGEIIECENCHRLIFKGND
ncbi:MAG: C4-type zinc ribbon domain-containing protein [Clostridia bacterium]|nr:C4-type zinc ribbon domain-containing protein [Clostridia bacterium]